MVIYLDLVNYSELDERAIEALKELDEDGAVAVLKQFRDSNLQVNSMIYIR